MSYVQMTSLAIGAMVSPQSYATFSVFSVAYSTNWGVHLQKGLNLWSLIMIEYLLFLGNVNGVF